MQNSKSRNEDLSRLCRRCEDIDFGSLLTNPHGAESVSQRGRRKQEVDGLNLGRIAQYIKGRCSLCDFFLDILPAKAKEGDNSFYSYRLQSVRFSLNPRVVESPPRHPNLASSDIPDTVVFRLQPVPQVMPDVMDGPGIPFILPQRMTRPPCLNKLDDLIDFEVPRRWMSRCCSPSEKDCRKSLGSSLSSLKLIDCQTRRIVSAHDDTDYLTLSYVWGISGQGSNHTTTANGALPDDLPQTIEDAITITTELDYRYLWIDKYCITDTEDLQHQIQQMDLIYERSALTIVDAAGSDPYHGLPGVRPGSRSRQPAVRIGELELFSTMQRPEWDIESSPWSSRGWTFQEDILSKRRLIFTSQQMIFESELGSFREALAFPSFSLGSIYITESPPRLGVTLRNKRVSYFFFDIYSLLANYSQRSLTHDSDIMNATLGFFRHTMNALDPMFHFWGLPFRAASAEMISWLSSDFRNPSFHDSLRWTLKKPSSRRKGFPSWSWAGWLGEIAWPEEFRTHSDSYLKKKRKLAPLEISVEGVDGKILEFDDFCQHYAALSPCTSYLKPIIRISALTLNVIRQAADHDSTVFEPRFSIEVFWYRGGSRNSYLLNQVPDKHFVPKKYVNISCVATTTEYLGETEAYLAIILCFQDLKKDSDEMELMIIKKKGAIWERVALGAMNLVGKTEYSNIEWEVSEKGWREIVLG